MMALLRRTAWRIRHPIVSGPVRLLGIRGWLNRHRLTKAMKKDLAE